MKLIPFLFLLAFAGVMVYLGRSEYKANFSKKKDGTVTLGEIDDDIEMLNKKIQILEKDVKDGIKSSEEKLYKFKADLETALKLRQKFTK